MNARLRYYIGNLRHPTLQIPEDLELLTPEYLTRVRQKWEDGAALDSLEQVALARWLHLNQAAHLSGSCRICTPALRVADLLADLASALPSLRAGQIIGNVLPVQSGGDPYYITDRNLAYRLEAFCYWLNLSGTEQGEWRDLMEYLDHRTQETHDNRRGFEQF